MDKLLVLYEIYHNIISQNDSHNEVISIEKSIDDLKEKDNKQRKHIALEGHWKYDLNTE